MKIKYLTSTLLRRNQKSAAKDKEEKNAEELLSGLYEKLYFHEIEVREKITSRLQVPLAIGVAIVGLLGTMIQNIERERQGIWLAIFWIVLALAIISVFFMGVFFYRAAWGPTYDYLPRAIDLEEYRDQCKKLYARWKNCDELVKVAVEKALLGHYVKCSSKNSEANDLRSYDLFRLTRALVVAVFFTFIAFLVFFLGALDKNSAQKKPIEVKIVEPIQMKGPIHMNEPTVGTIKPDPGSIPTPPEPPPPPPERTVHEPPPATSPSPGAQEGSK